jgi:structural maintenance of chromosomes protein 5
MSSTINARASARKTYALITTETRPSFKVPFEYNRQVSIDNPVKMPLEREGSKVHELENGTQDEDQQAKRRRTEAGKYSPQLRLSVLNDRFAAGSILRVTLTNFVTYTSAEFFPGPNMNLVIGPNGSGKSTIVCAICLGLGYSPNVLGRATAVSDFVQHGKDGAEIEIELALPENKSMIIKRKIKKDKNTSQFFVNGTPVIILV